MLPSVKLRIDQSPPLKRYLREHSYWYKYLNRNPASIVEMEKEIQTIKKDNKQQVAYENYN